MPRRDLRGISDERLSDVIREFMQRDANATRVAQSCNAEWKRRGSDFAIKREDVYPLLLLARQRGYFHVAPPLAEHLGQRIADLYGHLASDVKVVAVRRELDFVAASTARITCRLIQLLGREKPRVHLGLGAGRTTWMIARHLAAELRATSERPQLTLHAISSGIDVKQPWKAPLAFFGLFDDLGPKTEYIGLFAPAVVEAGVYREVLKSPGVRESFDAKAEIDIVITSLASIHDPHGDLNQLLEVCPRRERDELLRRGVVGDVQHRAFSAEAPVLSEVGNRAVTLFELDELRALAATPGKYVVLVSGPCGACGRLRSDALQPLVANPKLKVWSHLVVDLDTAEDMIAARSPSPARAAERAAYA